MKKRSRSAKGVVILAFVVFAVVVGALVFRKYHTATQTATHPVAPAAPAQEQPVGAQVVTLFFASPDGEGLVREGREVEPEEGIEDSVESVLEDLISGPVGSHAPTLPGNTRVLGVKLKGSVAEIDLSREFADGLPEGSSAEMVAVYSVVDTVAANFPQIRGVQFLIEGAPTQTLKGHLDLTRPVAPDYSLEKKS